MKHLSLYERWKAVTEDPDYNGIYDGSITSFNQIIDEIGPEYILDLYDMTFGGNKNEA